MMVTIQCVILTFLICSFWLLPAVNSYHATNELSIKLVNNDNNKHILHDNHRQRRKIKKFDWQKDSSEDTSDEDYVTTESLSRKLVPEYKQPPTDLVIDTTTSLQQQHELHHSDIKAILWSDNYGAHSNLSHRKSSATAKMLSLNRSTSSSIPFTTELQSDKTLDQTAIHQDEGYSTTLETNTIDIPSETETETEESEVMVTFGKNLSDDQRNHMNVPDVLSANEDKLRTYTLPDDQKYGKGMAKPKIITQKLAEMETLEYKSDEENTHAIKKDNIKVTKMTQSPI